MKTHTSLKAAALVATGSLIAGSLTQAATVIATTSGDHVLQGNFEQGNPSVFLANNSNRDRAGLGGAGDAQRVNQPVLGFTLPTIPVGDTVSSVEFTVDFLSLTGTPAFDVVVSLLNATAIGDLSGSEFFEGTAPVNSPLANGIVIGGIDTSATPGTTQSFTLTGAALSSFADLYGTDGNPTQTEVFFRLSTSAPVDSSALTNVRYNFPDPGATVTRSLTIETVTAVPEPSSALLLGFGALALGRRRRA